MPTKVTRRFIMQKARSHPTKGTPTACRQTGSGSISLLCSRCFSPFPHGTGSLSVSREYLALRDGPRCFRQDFSCPALLRILLASPCRFAYGSITLYSVSFQILPLPWFLALLQSYNPGFAETNPVWAVARSLATTGAITFVFFSCRY